MYDDKAKEALRKLGAMPGMREVKTQIEKMFEFSRVSKQRKTQGLKTLPQSNHMIFTGNPGTGKTTAARLIGEAFAALGLLKTANKSAEPPFIEIHHADITHPHVGQAERTIKAKFAEARGGVLFIDEAYAFVAGNSVHATGEKVIAAIVQLMEDMRDEIVVIAAGYPEDMEKFIDENPGLRSRFSTTVHFPDYDLPELIQIAAAMLAERDYEMARGYSEVLSDRLREEKMKASFGNARTVRNLIEQSIRRQSVRVSRLAQKGRADLMQLTEQDLPPAAARVSEKSVLIKSIAAAQKRLTEIEREEILYGKVF